MAIKEISTNGLPLEPLKGKKVQNAKESKTAAQDKVELSAKARSLYETEQTKKVELVRQKIEKGFYRSQEVNEKIVEGLLVDLKKPEQK